MYLDDLIPAPTSKKVAEVANKIFGYSLDMESLDKEKAERLRESFTNRLSHLEKKLGSKVSDNKIYMQSTMFLEAIDKYLAETPTRRRASNDQIGGTTRPGANWPPKSDNLGASPAELGGEKGSGVGPAGQRINKPTPGMDRVNNALQGIDINKLNPEQKKSLIAKLNDVLKSSKKLKNYGGAGKVIAFLGMLGSAGLEYLEPELVNEIETIFAEDSPDSGYEVDELMLYAENDYDLYSRSYVPIAKNLSKKFKKGIYDSHLATKLWYHHMTRAAKKYGEDHMNGARDGLRTFSTADRREAARNVEDAWHQEMQAGNFMESNVNESVITEGELENAELVLAAKDMVDKIQGMVEDLGEMQNEQLGPLTDAIRDEMGTDVADQFKGSMETVIVNALEAMRSGRDAAEQSSRILQGESPTDMMIGAEPAAMDMEEPAMEPTTGMDMEQPEEDFAVADAAQGGDEELGRERRA